MPDTVLADRTTSDPSGMGRIPNGHPTVMVTPGTMIRAEPKWVGEELAIMANGYFLDNLRDIDDAWSFVGYEDGDLRVRGFASRREPPGRVHEPHEAEALPAQIAPNAKVPKGTCLYARQHGEAIGFVVADRAAEISSGHSAGWFTLSFDTPWGPLTFAASGMSEQDLDTCGLPATP